jgi:hypothetical protein
MPQLFLENIPSTVQTSAVIELNIDVFPAPGKKYLTYDEHKRIIKGKFNTVAEYMKYIKSRGLEARGLVNNPYSHFGKDYKGWADFLGIEDTGSRFRSYVLAHEPWKLAHEARRRQGEISRQRKIEERAHKKQLRLEEKARQKQLVLEEKGRTNEAVKEQKNQTLKSFNAVPLNPLAPNLDYKMVCEFLINKGMGDIAESIAYHKKLSLTESREVTKHLIEHYKHMAMK